MAAEIAHPPLLTAVASVCALRSAIAALDHVAQSIDACLDPSNRCSIVQAVNSGAVRLLDRVLWSLHQNTSMDEFVREMWLRRGFQVAVRRGDMQMIQRLHQFHPEYLAANALQLAAEQSDVELFKWLYTHRPEERDCITNAIIAAAAHGCLAILRYLLDNEENAAPANILCPSAALRSAVEHGHCDVADYLTSKNVRARLTGLDDEIARHGHLEMVKWLHVKGLDGVFTTAAMDAAAGAGHFDIVKFLHENRDEGCRSWAMDGAATGGYLEIVEYLFANRREGCTARAVNGATKNGHLHVLQWFYDNLQNSTSIWTTEAATNALVHGHYDVLTWLQTHFPQHMTRLPPYAALETAKEGNLRGLQMLHEMHGDGIRWSPRVMDVAAASGDMAMVEWLYENRPNDGMTTAMDRAAEAGKLDVVEWLHRHELACTTWAMDKAAAGGYLDVVKWFHSYRSEGCTTAAMNMAAASGHLEVVQWLHENRHEGCTTDAMDGAAIGGHLEVVVWLQRHRSEGCTVDAMDRSAALGNWEVVQWLARYQTANACSQNGLRDAATRGRLRILKFLQSTFDLQVTRTGILSSVRDGYIEVVQWALTEQRLIDVDADIYLPVALLHGHYHIVQWLEEWNQENTILPEIEQLTEF